METKKLASEEFTACKEIAKVESIVSISFPKRFSMRPATKEGLATTLNGKSQRGSPWGVVSWKRKVARTTVTKSCLNFSDLVSVGDFFKKKISLEEDP